MGFPQHIYMNDFYRQAILISIKVFFFSILFNSCNIINPPEPIPSYLHVDTFNFYTTNLSQGSRSNKIEDVWVYIDNNLQGIYRLPASVPILESGSHLVKLRPGIYFNGMKSNRLIYPFYSIYDTLVDFTEGQETVIYPHSTYNTGLTFTNENFDNSGGIIFDTTSKSKAFMTITTNSLEVFEGNGSGKAILDTAHPVLEIATKYIYDLPKIGSNRTIIELNYKTSVVLNIGLYVKTSNVVGSVDEQLPILSLNKNDEWNKVYLEITGPVHAFQSSLGIKIYFYAVVSDLNQPATVYLDNFKLIYD